CFSCGRVRSWPNPLTQSASNSPASPIPSRRTLDPFSPAGSLPSLLTLSWHTELVSATGANPVGSTGKGDLLEMWGSRQCITIWLFRATESAPREAAATQRVTPLSGLSTCRRAQAPRLHFRARAPRCRCGRPGTLRSHLPRLEEAHITSTGRLLMEPAG